MADAEVIRVLREARALISNPEKWTQGSFARTATGRSCGAVLDLFDKAIACAESDE